MRSGVACSTSSCPSAQAGARWQAALFVETVNGGNRTVPTLVFEDGTVLVEPSDRQLAEKLGITV